MVERVGYGEGVVVKVGISVGSNVLVFVTVGLKVPVGVVEGNVIVLDGTLSINVDVGLTEELGTSDRVGCAVLVTVQPNIKKAHEQNSTIRSTTFLNSTLSKAFNDYMHGNVPSFKSKWGASKTYSHYRANFGKTRASSASGRKRGEHGKGHRNTKSTKGGERDTNGDLYRSVLGGENYGTR